MTERRLRSLIIPRRILGGVPPPHESGLLCLNLEDLRDAPVDEGFLATNRPCAGRRLLPVSQAGVILVHVLDQVAKFFHLACHDLHVFGAYGLIERRRQIARLVT